MSSMESLVANENRKKPKMSGAASVRFSGIANAVDTGNKQIDSILAYGMKKPKNLALRSGLRFGSTVG